MVCQCLLSCHVVSVYSTVIAIILGMSCLFDIVTFVSSCSMQFLLNNSIATYVHSVKINLTFELDSHYNSSLSAGAT